MRLSARAEKNKKQKWDLKSSRTHIAVQVDYHQLKIIT